MNNRKNYIWNLIYSFVNAAQSLLLLWLVTKIINEDAAGVFSYAFSVAVLLMYVGNFGIRNYQVSDTREKYSYKSYYGFRLLSVGAMLICTVTYLAIKQPAFDKMMVILFMCLWRLVESIEDVFHGRYQQKDALYLGCIQGSIRLVVSDIIFLAALFYTRNLAVSSVIFFVCNMIFILAFAVVSLKGFGGLGLSFDISSMKGLFAECLSLFLGYFLTTYLCNAGKYSLEVYENNSIQAYYGMIFMPVLLINLLSTVIFRPIIVQLATMYNEGHIAEYKKKVFRQELVIVIIAIIVLPICFFVGIPVLSWFYGCNLANYRWIFMYLMVGGIFSAFSSFLNVCVITIRKQNALIIATAIIAVITWVITGVMTRHMSMLGTALSYLIAMVLQAVSYMVIHNVSVTNRQKDLTINE